LIAWNLTGDIVCEHVEIFCGLRDGDTRLQVAEGDEVAVVTVPADVIEIDDQGREDLIVGQLERDRGRGEFVCFGKVEVLGKDAYDLVGSARDLEGPSDDGGIAAEEGLPETVADDDDLVVSFDGLLRQEVAALSGLDAKDVEEVGLGDDSADEAWVVFTEADAGGSLAEDGEVSEGSGLSSPEVCVAGTGADVGEESFEEADALPYDDEAAAVAVGKGLEEDAVDDAEEGGGGSDAEGEGEDGGEGEAGRLAKLA
jgi:hypothetical protein